MPSRNACISSLKDMCRNVCSSTFITAQAWVFPNVHQQWVLNRSLFIQWKLRGEEKEQTNHTAPQVRLMDPRWLKPLSQTQRANTEWFHQRKGQKQAQQTTLWTPGQGHPWGLPGGGGGSGRWGNTLFLHLMLHQHVFSLWKQLIIRAICV